jgi:hypothetical protein
MSMKLLFLALAIATASAVMVNEDQWIRAAEAIRADTVEPLTSEAPVRATPSGTYSGTKSILGEKVSATVTIDDTTHMDLTVSGVVSVNCKGEAYNYDASSGAVTVPGASKSGDCIHDTLQKNGASLQSVSYDASSDSVTVKVKKIIDVTLVLKKSSSLVAAAAEYEKPPCASGEDAVQVQGLSGDFCSPKCSTSTACPALPSGVTGKAKCVLQTAGSSGPTNCAVICNPSQNSQCPTGASCQAIQGLGICTYPTSKYSFLYKTFVSVMQ